MRGKRAYTAGASTITQQVVRNVFLPKMFPGMTLQDAREKSLRRKLLEIVGRRSSSRTRASKDEILEMYLNDMTLGQRGSFAIVGVAGSVAAVLRQGRQQRHARRSGDDRRRLSSRRRRCRRSTTRPAAGIGATSCCRRWSTPATSRRRRPTAPSHEPLIVVQRALEAEAPYFVDFVGQTLAEQYPGPDDDDRRRRSTSTRRSICTCSGWRRTPCATA